MGLELVNYRNDNLNSFTAELFYKETFSKAIDELEKGNCALVFHTTGHYVAIVDCYNNGSERLLQVVNPSGDYNQGSHSMPTNWLSEKYMEKLFASYDSSSLIVKNNYNLSENLINQLNKLYDDLGGNWENNHNINERISDIGM